VSVRTELIETPDVLILAFYADRLGDKFSLPKRIDDLTVLAGWGEGKVMELSERPWDVDAPALILFSPTEITCEALADTLRVYCLYDKNTGPLDDVRAYAR
jgi:hypothetical protein